VLFRSKVHWRFVEESQVPYGPWKKYGRKTDGDLKSEIDSSLAEEATDSSQAEREYLEYLRELRERQFSKRP